MSKVFATKFQPIQYCLDGGQLSSYVKYHSRIFGSGWLCASGTMSTKDDDSVEVMFDNFWVDPVDELRLSAPQGGGSSLSMDNIVGSVGRASFFPSLAVFPVLYLDDDMCVFKFPALNSQIAVKKVA